MDNSEPAFPDGMSLRQWYAGQALDAAARFYEKGVPEWRLNALFGAHATGLSPQDIIAALAFEMADAMIKRSNK